MDLYKNKSIKKMIKKLAIRRIMTKFDIKIKWKIMLRGQIEKKNKKENDLKHNK
jgi:hypothetical protein